MWCCNPLYKLSYLFYTENVYINNNYTDAPTNRIDRYMELQTRARQELDRIAVKYHDMTIEDLIELTEHMHHLATKLHMFRPIKEPVKDKDPTNN